MKFDPILLANTKIVSRLIRVQFCRYLHFQSLISRPFCLTSIISCTQMIWNYNSLFLNFQQYVCLSDYLIWRYTQRRRYAMRTVMINVLISGRFGHWQRYDGFIALSEKRSAIPLDYCDSNQEYSSYFLRFYSFYHISSEWKFFFSLLFFLSFVIPLKFKRVSFVLFEFK